MRLRAQPLCDERGKGGASGARRARVVGALGVGRPQPRQP